MSSKTLQVAWKLAQSGISVIPIKPSGKSPALWSWKSYQKDRADEELIYNWFNCSDNAIGVVGGAVSGNLEILDFDEPEYYPAFVDVCGTGRLGELVNSCCLIQTPSGGHHLYYRCEEPVSGSTKLARTDGKNGPVEVKIETRGEGGYALTYPSPAYKIIRGKPTQLPVLTKVQVELLHSIAQLFDEYVEPPKNLAKSKNYEKREGLTPWHDYDERGPYCEVLQKHGWFCIRCNAGDYCMWRRPGKSTGVSATTGYAGRRVFCCFTSNGMPFDPWSYTPSAVYSILEHNGDFRAAAKALKGLGYGS